MGVFILTLLLAYQRDSYAQGRVLTIGMYLYTMYV